MTDSPVLPQLPHFVVVGKVNMGKTSVLATLLEIDDQRRLRITATPGETTRVQVLPLAIQGREVVRFLDSPGFHQAIEAMRAIQERAGATRVPSLEHLRGFAEAAEKTGDFEDERLLLQPILAGAGILYVVDASKPLRDDFEAEMEILRWSGRPRLAILNEQSEHPEHREAWKTRLGSHFNLVRTFNAHQARFPQRLQLFEALLSIEEDHRGHIEETIRHLQNEWLDRRAQAAEFLYEHFRKTLPWRAEAALTLPEFESPRRKEAATETLRARYHQGIAQRQRACLEKLLSLYRHHLLQAEEAELALPDLEIADTWKRWGLNRQQLLSAGAVAGATAGGALDLAVGGTSFLAGTALGGLLGAGAAWWRGEQLPELKVDVQGIRLHTDRTRTLVVGPPGSPNFPWILLDHLLNAYRQILSRPHAKREATVLENDKAGPSHTLSGPTRQNLQRFFAQALKSKLSPDQEVPTLTALEDALTQVEEQLT
ncbi:MAG: DUF3482 domain-containing protein [Verrucomicrobiota bacterium]